MAHRRRPATGAGERRIQGRHEIFGERMRATGSGWSDIVADAGTPMPHRDTWRGRIARRHPSFFGELASRPQPTNRGLPVHPRRHQQIQDGKQDGQEDKMILHRLLPDPGDVEIRPGRFCFLSPTPFRSMPAATRRLSMMTDTRGRHPLKTLENLNILEARSRNEDR